MPRIIVRPDAGSRPRRRTCAARALGLVLLLGATARAATTDTASVPVETLLTRNDDLASWLTTHQPELFAARARVEQADAALDQSHVIPNPTLGVAVGGISVGARNPSSLGLGDTMNVTVGLSETIELGKRGPRGEAARLRRDAARAGAHQTLADRLADARDALARVVYAEERVGVLKERFRSAQHVAELEQVRLEHGDISGIDHDRLELDAAAAARELADNRGELELALADCSALLLGSCEPGPATMETVDASAPLPEQLQDVASLVRSRPDIAALRLASAASRSDAVLYGRQGIPDPTVGVSYTRDFLVAAGNQPNTLMASVSLPLPLFDHGQHLRRGALGQAAELEYEARTLEARAFADARALLARRDVLVQKLAALSDVAIPKSDAVLKASDDAYHHGQLSLTDLLLVRREHASLLLAAIDTRYELFNVRNTLYRALGLGQSETARAASR